MASGKEIRNKIKSVQNTKKITKAMEMVAASKMRKAQDRMRAARPYAEKIRRLAANLSAANITDYKHPFLVKKDDVKRGAHRRDDRQGSVRRPEHQHLACGLNKLKDWESKGVTDIRVTIGNKGLGFCSASVPRWSRTSPSWATPAPGQADRPGQGAAGRVSRRRADAVYLSTPASSTR
jgi:F-type H+-transporting ATPase subunit gamma